MAVTFVLGRAGAGKTHHCLEALRAELARDETRRLIVLVPEQASFQTERSLALRAPGAAYWRAEVLSFSRLARRVFAATGGEPLLLERGARELALRSILTRDPDLAGVFRASARAAGFHAALDRLIEELLHENVAPAQLADAAEKLTDRDSRTKVAQLARLYAAYIDWLGAERVDPAQRLALLRTRLEQATFLDGSRVWVDGFAGFTGQEVETLGALARRAETLTITLLVDPRSPTLAASGGGGGSSAAFDPLNLFGRTERTYHRLRRRFQESGVVVSAPIVLAPEIPPRLQNAAQLVRLERALIDDPPLIAQRPSASPQGAARQVASSDVRLLRCASPAQELREAARFIWRSVLESAGRLRWSDFAVIARDLEPLAAQAAEVFSEYEVPVFIDRRRPMRVHPLGRLVESLFEAVISDFSVAATTRLLRTELLPLDRDYAQELETRVFTEQIRGLRLWQRGNWNFESPRTEAPPPAQSVLRRAEARSADSAQAARPRLQMIAALAPLTDAGRQSPPPTGAQWAALVFDVLERLGVGDRISNWIAEARRAQRWESAETHRLAWDALVGVLDDVHAVLADTPLEPREAAALLTSALGDVTIGLAPPTLDQVLVSAIERSRHPEIKHAWVIGVNEGVFPARPADDALLTHDERAELTAAGLPAPAPRRDEIFGERLLAYIAFTRPSVGLTISFAGGGADGQPLAPSPLIALVQSALPEVVIETPEAAPPPLTATEFARGYLGALGADKNSAAGRARPRFEALRRALSQSPLAPRVAKLLAGTDYRNRTVVVPDLAVVARATGAPPGPGAPAWTASLSQIDTYLQCPFKFFARFALGIAGPAAPSPVPAALGECAHKVLARVTLLAREEPGDLAGISSARWQELLAQAVNSVVANLPAELSERRPHLRYLTDRLFALLPDAVLAHAERWKRGVFRPVLVERTFGDARFADTLPAALVRLDSGKSVAVSGRIDRVDACDADGRRVLLAYDYKPHASPLGRREILTDVWLQLFTYLLALRAIGEDAAPAGVFVAPLRADLSAVDAAPSARTDPALDALLMFRPRGAFDAAVAPRLDAEIGAGSTDSPVAHIKVKKDGEFTQACDAKPAERISAWLALAEETIAFAGAGVVRGEVAVAPLVERKTLACVRCEFQSLCRFDRPLNIPRDAYVTLPRLKPAPGKADRDDEGATS